MKISVTEVGPADRALIYLDENGVPDRWLMLDSAAVILRGDPGEPFPVPATAAIAVPGEQVAIHWLDLAEGLAPAQATAAARLLLADASAHPIATLHVAVGRPEQGLTPVALVASSQMAEWLATSAAAGLDPDIILPTSMLLAPPPEGLQRYDRANVTDYRGLAVAFSLEPTLAEAVLSGVEAEPVPLERFESDLGAILADPPLNLRQGVFARRRSWPAQSGQLRRIIGWALAFLVLSLALQVTMILRYTFAADSAEAEARALATPGPTGRSASFGAIAAAFFDSVQGTPNVELTRLEYRSDGSLSAGLQADSTASLVAFEQRAEASGLQVELGSPRMAGGRHSAEVTVR